MLGEFELIEAIRARIEAAGAPASAPGLVLAAGDDATISIREGATATSVDALVDGVHFRLDRFEPRLVGHKALAAALSDLAAMGAEPLEAYIQLCLPTSLADESVLELADGIGALAARLGVAVVGGDVVRAPALTIAVTAVGRAVTVEGLIRRDGARANDLVAVTGELGGAAAGLMALDQPQLARGLDPQLATRLRRRQTEPQPRLAAGRALASAGATAMIDISDGLGGDAGHLASASAVGLRIDGSALPLEPGVVELAAAAGVDAVELATGGGEDYELLLTLPAARAEAAIAAAGATGLTVIGEVVTGTGVELSRAGGAGPPPAGFDQLRGRGRSGPA